MWPAILLFISGAAALVYQTLWVKQLALVVGVDVYAVTTAVSAFFAGLALGSAVFGRWADRTTRPFMLYAGLEVGIAVLGIAGTLALARSAPIFVAFKAASGPLAWLLPFSLIGLPAFFMGGTLPALVRAVAPDNASVGRASGFLYAANTAGGILGTLATPFLLIPALGVRSTALVAVTLNLLIAALAAAASRPRAPLVTAANIHKSLFYDKRLALVLYALAGGVALGYEVVWTQSIVQFLSTRAYAFAIVLATYLTGLVLGSGIYSCFADRVRRPWIVFGLLIAGAGASALLTTASIGPWLPQAQNALGKAVFRAYASDMLANSARFAFAAAVVVLVPTTLLGAAFPAAIRLIGSAGHIGRDVGIVTALNMAGGIAGTFLTGFLLVPMLGLIKTLGSLAVASSVLGSIAIIRGADRRRPYYAIALILMISISLIAVAGPKDKFARLLAAKREGTLVFYEESPGGTVAVVEQGSSHLSFRRLYIQGTSNSGDALTSIRYMRLQALLPLLIHKGEPKSALVVGLGTGITTGALLTYPSLEQRVCVELLPAVVRAVPLFKGNFEATSDPRIDVRISDGRYELLRTRDRYDLITLEPPPPTAAGVANLYSRDFYELSRDRLAPNGLMAQWWPLPTQNDEDSRSLVRSFIDVFPHVTVWTTELHEMLLVGSMEPVELDAVRIANRFKQPLVSAALSEVGIASPAALMATYVTDRAGLERYAGDAPPVTDDRPLIEYAGWVRDGEFARVLPRVLAVSTDLPLLGADRIFRANVETEQRRLMNFYRASLHAYAGEQNKWAMLIRKVIREDPGNPYYRWFVGKR